MHYSLEKGNGVWSNRVYWGADELVAPLVDSLMMHLFPHQWCQVNLPFPSRPGPEGTIRLFAFNCSHARPGWEISTKNTRRGGNTTDSGFSLLLPVQIHSSRGSSATKVMSNLYWLLRVGIRLHAGKNRHLKAQVFPTPIIRIKYTHLNLLNQIRNMHTCKIYWYCNGGGTIIIKNLVEQKDKSLSS